MRLFIRVILTLIVFTCSRAQVLIGTAVQADDQQNWHISSNNDTSLNWQSSSSLLWSPTPDDYANLYNVACGVGKNGSKTPLDKRKLIEIYARQGNKRLKQVVDDWNIHQECRRDPTAWRFKYIDEMGKVLINERTVDERSANIVAMIRAVKAFSIDMFTYDWNDPAQDQANMDLAAGPKFNDNLCGQQLGQMMKLANELNEWSHLVRTNSTGMVQRKLTDQHISLAKSFDSFGRHESGRLMGKFYFPGSYHQCLFNQLILDQTTTVAMRYCWAHLSYEQHLSESLRKRRRSIYENPVNVIYAGVCLPESCHSKSFDRHKSLLQQLINTQFKQPLTSYADEHLNLKSLYCVVDEESNFGIPLAGKCLLGFILGWCLLTFGVTIYNSKIGNSAKWQEQRLAAKNMNMRKKCGRLSLIESLDLMESWQNFTDYYTRPSQVRAVQLDAMNFFKVFGCAFVVFGHTMALFGAFSGDELRAAHYMETDAVLCMIVAGTLVVDTFFVMSGILWAYFSLKALNVNKLSGESNAPANLVIAAKEGNGRLAENLANSLEQSVGRIGKLDESLTNESSTFIGLKQRQEFELHPEGQSGGGGGDDDDGKQAAAIKSLVESWPTTIKLFCARWFSMSIFRYLRIVPTYALVHWFKKYVFIYSGTGPFWDHGFNYNSLAGSCIKETPLTPFTFMAAYYPISRQCTLQSWSIANDLFFALLAPPIILLINKRPRVAAWLTLLSCIISYAFGFRAISSYPSELDEELRELRAAGFYRLFDEVSQLYTAPHYRIFCFLVGVWAGYALYHCQAKIDKRKTRENQHDRQQQQQQVTGGADLERDQVGVEFLTQICVTTGGGGGGSERHLDKIEWPSWLRSWATILSIGYIIFTFSVFGFNQSAKNITFGFYRFIYPHFVTTLRVIWSLSNAVILIRMMTDWKDSLLMRWSASKFWQAFSKLCFAILLIHLDMLLYTINVSPTMPTSFTKWSFFNFGAGIYLLCIPLAMFVHVVFEMPFDKLIRSRLPKGL